MNETPLERRYRRLLACYPAAYQAEYGEEMIGVLLASTPGDQDRPTRADAVDLIGGGLRVRFRRLRTGDGNSPWRDALAVFSVVAPVWIFIMLAGAYVLAIAQDNEFRALGFRAFHSSSRVPELLIASTLVLAAVMICPFLARSGRGRGTGATAVAVVAAVAAITATVHMLVDSGGTGTFEGLIASVLVVEIVAVLASPGPGRGWELLGRGGLIILIGLAAVLSVSTGLHLAGLMQPSPFHPIGWWNLANAVDEIAPVVGIVLIAIVLRWSAGSRLLAIFAIPAYPFIGFNLVTYAFPMYLTADQTEYLPAVAIAALVAAAAWRSGRRRTG